MIQKQDQYFVLMGKIFFRLFAALFFNALASSVAGLVDGAVIGRFLGSTAIAAQGIVGPIVYLVNFFSLFGVGCQILCSKSFGSGNIKEVQRIFSKTLSVALLIGVSLTLILFLFADPIVTLLGARGDMAYIKSDAAAYVKGYAFGMLPAILNPVLIPVMCLLGDEKRTSLAVIFLTVSNIVFDFVAIGLNFGMFGIGLGSSVGQFLCLILLLTHFASKKKVVSFTLTYRFSGIVEICRRGLTKGVSMASQMVCSICLNYIILYFAGGAAMSAYGVRILVSVFASCIICGVSNATLMIGGLYHGEENRKGCRALFQFAVGFTVVASLITWIVLWLLAPFLSNNLITGEKVEYIREITVEAIRAFTICIPFYAFNSMLSCFYQSGSNGRISVVTTFLEEFGLYVFNCMWLTMFFGTRGLWYGAFATDFMTFLIFVLVVMFRKKRIVLSGDDWMLLPERFDVDEEDKLHMMADSIEQVMDISRQVETFCKSHGIESDRGYKLALCVEEMGRNIIEHGFGEEKHLVSFRIFVKDGDLTLSMRDDCPKFDPKAYLQMCSPKEKQMHLGISMVMKLAKDVSYVNVVNMNWLVITL